jgi:hypothetical protein
MHALPIEALFQAMERQMVRVLADDDVSEKARTG